MPDDDQLTGLDMLSDDDRRAYLNPPLSIKLVAFLFIAVGISSAIDILLSLASGSLSFDVGVFGILIGRGILRFQNGSRRAAVVFTILPLISLGCVVVFIPFLALRGSLNWSWDLSSVGRYSVFPVLAAYLVWQYRVLRSRQLVHLCRMVSDFRDETALQIIAGRGYRFSLSSLMLIMMVIAIVLARASQESVLYETGNRQFISAGQNVEVAYSYSKHKLLPNVGRLDWVHFSHTTVLPNRSTRRGIRFVSNARGVPVLSVSDVRVQFPAGHQLGQSEDQQVTFAKAKVTHDQLRAFMQDVPPSDWKIQTLLDFVKETQVTVD